MVELVAAENSIPVAFTTCIKEGLHPPVRITQTRIAWLRKMVQRGKKRTAGPPPA